MLKNNYYLHFATDLKRAALALLDVDNPGAKTFITHADTIFKSKLLNENWIDAISADFDKQWNELYNTSIPVDMVDRQRYADKLLRLSSLVFLRITDSYYKAGIQHLDGEAGKPNPPFDLNTSKLVETPVIQVKTE